MQVDIEAALARDFQFHRADRDGHCGARRIGKRHGQAQRARNQAPDQRCLGQHLSLRECVPRSCDATNAPFGCKASGKSGAAFARVAGKRAI